MPAKRLREFLDDRGIRYVTIRHSPAFTAQEVAASAHVPGQELAKTVVVRVDGQLAMAVLPASFQVDLARLRDVTACREVELATEEEFRSRFPDCEPGAMPPFGNLYGMNVYVAEELTRDVEIAFNAGTHTELVLMSYGDFERVVNPKVAAFSSRHVA